MSFQEFFKIATSGQFAHFAWANENSLQREYADAYSRYVGEHGEEFARRQACGFAGQMLIDIASGASPCYHEDWQNVGLNGARCCGCGRAMTHSGTLGRAIPTIAP